MRVTLCTGIGIFSKTGAPTVGNRIVVVVIGIDAVGMVRIALAAELMETAVGGDPIDAAARPQHQAPF